MNKLAIVIVNYNAKDYLEKCVESLYGETRDTDFQVVVIDNASVERDFSNLEKTYPDLSIILNSENVGFATACNQGIRSKPAQFYLLLNPDCLILEHAVDKTLRFLESQPQAGIVGCRVKNPDGSLQLACRRSIPRPSTALYRFLKLSFLFPKSKRFARYNLSYLDQMKMQEVEAVSGSFLMFRAPLLDDIGYLDESFFIYGEDLDFCYRALLKGWKICYYPEAEVIHYKYQSFSRHRKVSSYHFYNAMEIFYRKHYYKKSGFLQNFLVLFGIQLLRLTRTVPDKL